MSTRIRRALASATALLLAGLVVPVVTAAPAAAADCEHFSPCYAPDTRIFSGPPATTTSRTAGFTIGVEPEDTDITYECKLEVVGGVPGQYSDCPTFQEYTDLELGKYTFSARATKNPNDDNMVIGESKTPEEARKVVTHSWEIVAPVPPSVPGYPQTWFGEAPGRWLIDSFFSVDIHADKPTVAARCTMDGQARSCSRKQFDVFNIRFGTHTATAAAVTEQGRTDPSPAVLRFAVPKRAHLFQLRGGWKRLTGLAYYRDQYALTKNKGAHAIIGFRKMRHIALLATKGPGHGKIGVYLTGKLVKKINLDSAKTRHRVVISIKNVKPSKKAISGQIKIVVLSKGKPVYLEGLGLSRHK